MAWLAALLSCVGFAGLALTMERHRPQGEHGSHMGRRRTQWRVCAVATLTLAYAVAVWHSGWGTGTVLWLGLASMAVPVVALALTYLPRLLAWGAGWRIQGGIKTIARRYLR